MNAAAPEWIPAAVLFHELRALGYRSGLTMLKALPGKAQASGGGRAVMRFEIEPARHLKADLAAIRRRAERLSVFIATLGRSSPAYVELIEDEELERF
ncbi:MAG: hypothetical protein ABSG46_14240 [Candidatus Binataceae bacterium]